MSNKPAIQKDNSVEAVSNEQLSVSQRFTNQVLKEFGSNVAGGIQVTDYQRQLIQGYFISIDRALKIADENRIRKNENNKDHKYDNSLAMTWNNINLNDLALDVVHYAKMGLDMMQDNHLSPIPYKNNKTQKYDVTLMPGYNGIQYIAEKYAVEKPVAVTIELVYSTDIFRPIKKSKDNKIEGYEFEIINAFDRGEVVGGFGYIEYQDPLKNKLIIMTMKDIEKRKPRYAAAEFWGGKVKTWENGKQVEQESDGWKDEMYLKTIKREVFSAKHIPRDPKKVDDAYQFMKMREARYAEMEAQAEIDTNANSVIIDITPEPAEQLPGPNVDRSTGEVIDVHSIPAQSMAQESMPGLNF
jgi:recombination protein RecT